MVRVHKHNSLLSGSKGAPTQLPPYISMKPDVRRAANARLVGRVIGGGDANDWLIGVNWLRRKRNRKLLEGHSQQTSTDGLRK